MFRELKIVEMAVFDPLKSAKIDFMKNQSGRKMAISTLRNVLSQNSQLGCPGL